MVGPGEAIFYCIQKGQEAAGSTGLTTAPRPHCEEEMETQGQAELPQNWVSAECSAPQKPKTQQTPGMLPGSFTTHEPACSFPPSRFCFFAAFSIYPEPFTLIGHSLKQQVLTLAL